MKRKTLLRSALLLAVLAFLGFDAGAVPAMTPHALPTSRCRLPGVAQPARCGALIVLENPKRADARRLVIHFAVVPASSGTALPDPIVVLMGGPGKKPSSLPPPTSSGSDPYSRIAIFC